VWHFQQAQNGLQGPNATEKTHLGNVCWFGIFFEKEKLGLHQQWEQLFILCST
jgi:hypothetical protein